MADTITEEGSIVSDQRALLESGEGADVVLVVGDLQLPAHSQFLAARSPVFAAMLRNDMQESRSRRIEITDMRDAVVRQMLSFIYSDEVPLLESMAAELLAAAEKYNLPLLKKRCEQQLVRDLTVENAADTAGIANLHRCPELTKAAVQFTAAHLGVLATAGWGRLLRENAEAALEISRQLPAAVEISRQLPAAVEISRQLAAVVQPSLAPPPKEEPKNRTLSEDQTRALSGMLVAAASKGQTDDVRTLLYAGVPIDGKDNKGETALNAAVDNGHTDTVKCLIDAGADVNLKGVHGWTPLINAAARRDEHIIWLLLAKSANVNLQDDGGETPLHVAARNGNIYATKALLLAGAKRDVKDDEGKTPGDKAHLSTKALVST